jgi:hypothetical protein
MGHKQHRLILRVAEEPKLGLNGVKPIVCLKQFTRFAEGRWVGGQKLRIGALGLITSIADSIASTGGICHE